jgi:hypothetical protein
MADTKITALAAIATVDPAADVLPIVDISDTSMAASGTTKKVTTNQILQAGGTATLASATVTGDLTVATNTLKTTSGNVGIGTVTPDIFGRFYTRSIGFDSSGSTILQINGTSYGGVDLGAAGVRTFSMTSSATDANISTVTNIPMLFGINNTEAMRLNTTGNLVLKGGTANANGVGVTFPATQVASSDANTLDDYEEGTFVPTQGAGLTVVGTFSSSGTYTKVGRLVTIAGSVNGSTSIATAAAGFMCAGLPFASSQQNVGGAVNSATTVSAHCITNVTDFYSITAIGATTSIRFSATYQV